ncbi:ATP12 family chaperone protein [Roseobacter sp. HKCCA0434]|uniref:ATP12 family chaperone protein n=1 Tax=Roseobacter sp. HKCCA0434 TaxID=3079297 RepID=UPI002905CA02|nr:ATP12 family protein [Roseobacter sp. HKCCA0434]
MSGWQAKRFWKQAAAVESEGGFAIELDGRPVRTPAKAALVVPTRTLADGIAAEWQAQDDQIRPETMPLTRAANSALDKVVPHRAAVVEMLAEYGDTDLLCYRADGPESLVAEQEARWDPWLDWSEEVLRAPLTRVIGVIPQPQPAASLAALRARVEGEGPFALASLHDFVTLTGSLVLGLAMRARALDATEALAISELDALWQERLWGTDAEAAELRAKKGAQLAEAARFLDLAEGKET